MKKTLWNLKKSRAQIGDPLGYGELLRDMAKATWLMRMVHLAPRFQLIELLTGSDLDLGTII